MPQRLLIFSKTTGYRHDSIEAGINALREIADGNGLTAHATEAAGTFIPSNLARYAGVIFLSTSGEVFDAEQRAALEGYVRGGGGYVGIHAASTTEYDWPFYGDLAGARFTGHPQIQKATVTVTDDDHPSTAHLPNPWVWTDEWYNFAAAPRGSRTLLTVNESTYEGGTMGAHHPIAWCHEVDAGRCFYTALGHATEYYDDPDFRDHLLGGIRSVLGA